MTAEERKNPAISSASKNEMEKMLKKHLKALAAKKHIKHVVAAVESMDGSFRWAGAEGIAHQDGPSSMVWA